MQRDRSDKYVHLDCDLNVAFGKCWRYHPDFELCKCDWEKAVFCEQIQSRKIYFFLAHSQVSKLVGFLSDDAIMLKRTIGYKDIYHMSSSFNIW